MKWNKLPEKQPPFNIPIIVWTKNDVWVDGNLQNVTEDEKGKHFTFLLTGSKDSIPDVTHWAIPTKPKE
jgi:hypothetical protein